MSWHAGDWGNASISLVSAIGTVIASWMAYKAARSNSLSQEKMDEVKLFDNLLSIAQRIEDRTNGSAVSNLSSLSKRSIASLICLAHAAISQSGIAKPSQRKLKNNFMLMIPQEVNLAMENQKPGCFSGTDLDDGADMFLLIDYDSARKFFTGNE